MSFKIIIRVFKLNDFKDWLYKGINNGLNSNIISRNRALAQINNPFANKNDILLTAAYTQDKCIGYLGVLPEEIVGSEKRFKIAWFTTIYVDPAYRGHGIASKLINPVKAYYKEGVGAINAAVNMQRVLSKNSIDNLFIERERLYLKVFSFTKERLYEGTKKQIVKRFLIISFKPLINIFVGLRQKLWLNTQRDNSYHIEYIDFVDEKTMELINELSKKDRFPITQDKINWILKYKWGVDAPCIKRTKDDYYFLNYLKEFKQYGVVVYQSGLFMGFYIIRQRDGQLTIPYLYYNDNNKNKVFHSILEHCIALNTKIVVISDYFLLDYFKSSHFPVLKIRSFTISYSHTGQSYFRLEKEKLQDGDGDLFF